jgi:DNA gyrase subunit B
MADSTIPPSTNGYGASTIQVLEGLEAVRTRPGMYLGNPHDGTALHHLIWEAVDNAVDEHLAGYCKKISVTIHSDDAVTIVDDGRGIPVDMHEKGVSAAEVVMTVLHAGGKFGHDAYKVSAGLHGVGVSAVNAVSEWLRLVIWRDGGMFEQEYRRGVPQSPLERVGDSDRHGTSVSFKPDPEIFATQPDDVTTFSHEIIVARLREIAYLNAGFSVEFKDERESGRDHTFLFSGGIREFIAQMSASKEPLHDVIAFKGQSEGVEVDVALQWNASFIEQILAYTNNINNKDGGAHVTGLRGALTKSITAYGNEQNLLKDVKGSLTGEDIREGLTGVISVKMGDPVFDSQTKHKLVSSEVKPLVEQVVSEGLSKFLEENPGPARKILERVVLSAKAREAARKAREVVRKSAMDPLSISGKLADCQDKDPSRCELFIVEGESAGGSAKQGRERKFQAILPLKGKILNVEKSRIEQMLASPEIGTLITALGCGIGEVDLSRLRYHSIILMTDADVDGSHIRTLLLTLFFRQMRDVIEKGYLYIAQPPLFQVKIKKQEVYMKDQDALDHFLIQHGTEGLSIRTPSTTVLGSPLLGLLALARRFRAALGKMSRKGDAPIFSAVLQFPQFSPAMIRQRESAEALRSFLLERGLADEIVVDADAEQSTFRVSCTRFTATGPFRTHLDRQWVESTEFRELMSVYRDLKSFGALPFTAECDGEQTSLATFEELWNFVDARGRKGVAIKRFKGLGEMNPDQLWETTMNPDGRVLRQVTIQDAVETDQIFSILMGHQVEPRREFIEQNALNVHNLDI